MTGRRPVLLVVAKAPVPGQVKTRLSPPYSPHEAAALAAAALLDTLDACRLAAANAGAQVVVALSGDLGSAVGGAAVRDRLSGVRVVPQRGEGLSARLAAAHVDAAGPFGTTLQVGMDTPQLAPGVLAGALARLTEPDGADALLGLAQDGGWWALGLRRAGAARCLSGVRMSTPHTGAETLDALRAGQRRIEPLPVLRDVDTAEDVAAVAALSKGRFAALATALGVPAGAPR